MVLNADYSGFPGAQQQALDATTAHEFNHSLQYGYGALNGANAPDDHVRRGRRDVDVGTHGRSRSR